MEKGDRKIKINLQIPQLFFSFFLSPASLFPSSFSSFLRTPVSGFLSITAYYRVFSLVCLRSYSYTSPKISITVLLFLQDQ